MKYLVHNSNKGVYDNETNRYPTLKAKVLKLVNDNESQTSRSNSSTEGSEESNKDDFYESSLELHPFKNDKKTKGKKICDECGCLAPSRSRVSGKQRGCCENAGCDAFLCKTCKKKFALMPRSTNAWSMDIDPFDKDKANEWRTAKIHRFCRKCYIEKNIIDFNTFSSIFEPDEGKGCNITIIFSHGAGGSRVTFMTHAREMTKKYGVRSIVMDWAGHGARWQEQCTIDNCMNAVSDVLTKYNIKPAKELEAMGQKTLFAASSWGGYMAYHAMGHFPDYFSGVIVDSSMRDLSRRAEKIKWGAISKAISSTSTYSQMRFLQKSWNAKGKPYMDCIEAKFGAGVYGKSNPNQTMKDFRFENVMPKIRCPVLFLNGTKDSDGYDRKCQERVLDLLVTKDQSKVVLFKNGDHLFSHDYRFFQKWIGSAIDFARADSTHHV